MGKQSDKTFDDTVHKELLKNIEAPVLTLKTKKKETNMKTRTETIKTWTIVLLVFVIASIAMYFYAYNTGYNAKIADNVRINAEVAQQVTQLKGLK